MTDINARNLNALDSNLNSRGVSVIAILDSRSLLHNYEGGRYMQKDVQNKETVQQQEYGAVNENASGKYAKRTYKSRLFEMSSYAL